MRLLPYGDRALLVEPDSPALVLPMRRALDGVAGVLELVPAAATLLVRIDPARLDHAELQRLLDGVRAAEQTSPGPLVEIEVDYDGPDLELVAESAGWSTAEVIAAHTAAEYTVAFCGFAPGFAYLTGLAAGLRQPRLAEPRTLVPAGAVGIAGEFTGIYPRASPGGWRLLGHTDTVLWDLGRPDPALLTPGTRVRFVAS